MKALKALLAGVFLLGGVSAFGWEVTVNPNDNNICSANQDGFFSCNIEVGSCGPGQVVFSEMPPSEGPPPEESGSNPPGEEPGYGGSGGSGFGQ